MGGQADVDTPSNTQDEPTSGIEVQIPATIPGLTTCDPTAVDNGPPPFAHETRTSLPRAAALSQRQIIAESCAGEKDNDPDDESYEPKTSSRKRSRPNTTNPTSKRAKTANENSGESHSTSSTSTSPSKPPGKKASAKSKTQADENMGSKQSASDSSPETTQGHVASVADNKPRKVNQSGKAADHSINDSSASSIYRPQKKRIRITDAKKLVRTEPQGSTLDKPQINSEGSSAKFAAIQALLMALVEEKENEIQAAKKDAADLMEKNEALAAANETLRAEHKSLWVMRPTESEEVARLSSELIDLTSKIANQPEGYNRLRVNDDVISLAWTQLVHHIDTLSLKVATVMAKEPVVGTRESKFCSIIGQAAQAGPINPYLCAAFLKNWLWRCIIDDVIESDGGPWAGSISQAFVTYYRKLQALLNSGEVTPEFVSQVKSTNCCGIFAAHMAQEQKGFSIKEYMPSNVRDRLLRVQDIMMEDLNAFWHPTGNERNEAADLLKGIINKSSRLARHLLSSKAIFQIGSLDPINTFPAFGGTETRPTQHIVVAPSLLKRGTADGENFDQTTFLHTTESFEVRRSSE